MVAEDGIREILSGERPFSLVCQPVVDLHRGVIAGYEALARFHLDVPAPPDVVFACADHYGLGVELETMVVRSALALSHHIPDNTFLAINVDPEHLVEGPVFDLIVDHEGGLGGLVFELTEHSHIENLSAVARSLVELRKLGAFIAVDDAGAGYSGLQQIHALRPQLIKVDRALVYSLHADEAKRAMIQLLGELAERMDAWILAEGVETEAELTALAQLGVPLAQGFCMAFPEQPWAVLTRDVRTMLGRLPGNALATGLPVDLLEPCTSCDAKAPWPDAAGVCVRLESNGRPLGMRIIDDNGVRLRAAHELLRVKRSTSMSAIALRSAARSEALRWDPIVCVDELGHFEGVIHMHKLIWLLASRERDDQPTPVTGVTPVTSGVMGGFKRGR